MRVLKNLFGFTLMVGLLMLLVGFFLPARVQRTAETMVGAPSALIYEHLNDAAVNGSGNLNSDLTDIQIINSYTNDSLYTVSKVGREYKAYISYKLAPVKDSVKVKSTMLVELGMNPISRYYGLVLDARFGSMIEKNLRQMKSSCENRSKKG